MNKNIRGFINIFILLAVIVAVGAVGVGGYFVLKHKAPIASNYISKQTRLTCQNPQPNTVQSSENQKLSSDNLAIIDLDVDPPLQGKTIVENQKGGKVTIEKRSDGELYINDCKVILYLTPVQQELGHYETGANLHRKLIESNKTVLNARVRDYLYDNPQLIPESWKKGDRGQAIEVQFHGTVIRKYFQRLGDSYDYVMGLSWYNRSGSWYKTELGLGSNLTVDFSYPAAILAP